MSGPLEKWQENLEGHFATLAASRRESGLPIFALEHGLPEDDLEEITRLLHSRLRSGLNLSPHWLLWAVYATERGYSYSGDEYWPSFEESTPGWEEEDRYRLRRMFAKFQKTYNGVTPTGPWAKQFSIIAWPITHAVLPRYLQRQFAKALYDVRFRLASLTSIEPAVIGGMIAGHIYHSSTRFEEFLQQEELVGRIVLALLHKDSREGEESLLLSTLERIVGDLEKVRHAREWLNETSRVVTDRFKGIGHGAWPSGYRVGAPSADGYREREPQPDIRPNLLLRHVGSNSWSLEIDLPSFKSIAVDNPEIRSFLKRTRCSLNGGEGKKPAGWILSGKRRAVLKNWPDTDKPLVKFEQDLSIVDHLLESECRMSDGPVWLFRIGPDGIAREIAGRIVRPGFDYIIAYKNSIPEFPDATTNCAIDSNGIESVRISVPHEVPAEYIHWLDRLDLNLAKTIRVWPAGLPGRGWDGEGRSEWLTTEKPCFGIVHDHPIDSYVLNLDHGTSTVLHAAAIGEAKFVQLPQLPAGRHILTVKARRSSALHEIVKTPAHEGFIELRVREPEPWIPRTTSHAGLIAIGDPHDASLDAFWENDYNLSIIGPENRSVSASVILENGKAEEIFAKQIFSNVNLPVTPETWHRRFSEFIKRERCEWHHFEASAGILKICGQELGEYSLRFEHTVLPLRWVRAHRDGKIIVRLIDDTGQEDVELRCFHFSMENPVRVIRHDITDVLNGIEVQPPGGLFIAQRGECRDTILVSLGLTGTGLADLRVISDYQDVSDNPKTLVKVFRILRYWQNARLAGFIASSRQKQVVDGLLSAVYASLCGATWAKSEKKFIENPSSVQAVSVLQTEIGQRGGFSAVLCRDAPSIEPNVESITTWFTDLAQRYGVCRDPNLCAFAVKLAGQPHQVHGTFCDELEGLLREIVNCPVLLRGARFAALLSANQDIGSQTMIPGWQ